MGLSLEKATLEVWVQQKVNISKENTIIDGAGDGDKLKEELIKLSANRRSDIRLRQRNCRKEWQN